MVDRHISHDRLKRESFARSSVGGSLHARWRRRPFAIRPDQTRTAEAAQPLHQIRDQRRHGARWNSDTGGGVTTEQDVVVDVLVVGSGNGALTAALCAYELGVRDVLVVEKSEKYGGTSATSGGGVWIPCNRYARAAGAQDSFEEAREYLQRTIPPDAVPLEMLDTYLREGPKMIGFLHERTR